MLILTRRPGESIIIGDNIVVTVLGVKDRQDRLGTDAPKDITVHREEIQERINAGIPAPEKDEEDNEAS